MTRSELQEYGGENPIWGFVQRLAAERWTGQAVVGIDPRVELFVDEGRVYFAQKADDAPLGPRLLAVGVLTAEQLRRGSVQLGDTVSLARLFQRDPSVDRDVVELTVDRFAEHLLEQVAEHPTGTVSLHPLRHHPSGVHQWRTRTAAPVATDEHAMSALVQAVVSLSGEVPVVPATTTAEHPVAAPHLSAPHLAAPGESPMTFDPVVPPVAEPEPALPTLSSMPTLTPLPTLGAPQVSPPPTPEVPRPDVPQPGVLAELPSLAPLRPAAPPPAPAPVASAPSPVTPPANGAMMTPPVLGSNAAGAPPEGQAEEIWDMVDELLGLPHAAPAASTSSATEKKSRGWLRGRKG